MAAHRYWRAVGLEAYGAGDLELSAFYLLAAGVRVDAAATLTASVAPDVSGALANLQDSDLATSARWSGRAVKSLVLQWDFGGAAVDVDDIRLSGGSEPRFLLMTGLQWSSDGSAWTTAKTFAGITWPQKGSLTNSPTVSETRWSVTDRNLTNTAISADAITLSARMAASGRGAVGATSGKRQFEIRLLSGAVALFGVAKNAASLAMYPGGDANGWAYYTDGDKYTNNTASRFGAPWTTGDVMGVVLDFTAGTAVFYKNGESQGVAFSGLGGELFPMFGSGSESAVDMTAEAIYPFSYPVVGATPWADGYTGIATNKVRGRAATGSLMNIGGGVIVSYGAPTVAHPAYLGIESGAVKDQLTGVLGQGIGRVRATVKLKGTPDNTPLRRRVRLLREKDGLVLRETWSDAATGEYDFQYVDELGAFTVISYDYLHDRRAVVADNLTLANGGVELMP